MEIPQLLVIITVLNTGGILVGPDPKHIIQCSKCFSPQPAPKYEILQLLVLPNIMQKLTGGSLKQEAALA